MAAKQFKAESKRLLDLMIHSIYTHKEIFIRELISNASDAIDKLYYRSLTDQSVGMTRSDFAIRIALDKPGRTLTLSDNGCGMSKEDMENNLGTIARSGSLDFKKENETKEDIDIIGQFGVGFYSAFMVSDRVKVISRAFGSEEAFCWESKGPEGYTVTPCTKETAGTDVILHIIEDTADEKYSEFIEPYRVQMLVRKYSDYIRYPIKMEVEKSRPKADNNKEYETYTEEETLNSMVPLWKKNKSEVTDEEYNNFYKEKFHDYENPLAVVHSKTEGSATYNALLFVPAKTPYNYYTKEYEKGLQLYASGVLIMDKCADLLPDHFSFVRGLVDSQDLSLNISREMLQHDRQLKLIATSLEKKIKGELSRMLENEREKYEEFYKSFGLQLKFGVYNGFGAHKDLLKDLLLYQSSSEKKLVTLAEYVSRMKEDQKFIYYACGESLARLERLPQTELVRDKGFEILYMTDDVDEFAVRILTDYEGKAFKSVSAGDLGLESEEDKQKLFEQAVEHKSLFDTMKEALDGKVGQVRLSSRLKSYPVCLSSEGELTLEMEKVLNAMPTENKVKAERVLELNPEHPVFKTLTALAESNPEKLKEYSKLLYNQALLIEGMSIEDPVEFTNAVCNLMADQ